MTLRRLPETVVNRIAAGEVVERPGSAVKELVENAIDAGAGRIEVSLRTGGQSLIAVDDDGCGMRRDEMLLAVERHATSKLPDDDLTRILTLGFRGEALPSIAAVSRLTLTSRAAGAETAWTLAVAGGAAVGAPAPAARSHGTRVEVRDLFYATPARLKFLKSPRAELAHAIDAVNRLAMAHPAIAFVLADESRRRVNLAAAQGELFPARLDRLAAIMGRDFADNALAVAAERDGIRLGGFAGLPTLNRATAQMQYLFVNGRPVKDRLLAGAVRGAYQEQVPILVCAGEAITLGEGGNEWVGFHWARYLEDYGGPARVLEPVVKSTFGVNAKPLLSGSVHRACQLAMASPPGPVFLGVPFEYLADPAESKAPSATGFPARTEVDQQVLKEVAALLAKSRNPLIITEKLGKSAAAVEDLVALAERVGAVVVEAQHPEYVNFPRQHDLHGGFNAAPYLGEADVVLVIDVLGPPWYPETALRPAQAKVIAIGEDPLRARMPYYAIAPDITLAGRADAALSKLVELVSQSTSGSAVRRDKFGPANRERREQWHAMAQQQAETKPIDARWLCEVLNEALPQDAIVVDETILTNFTMLHVMDRLEPGQFINAMNGGLGTGLGAALGVKIANPDRPVIAIMGDGGFNYNPSLAAVGFCQEYQIPITIIIGDNGGWRAMQMVTEQLYPKGWAKRTDNYYGSYISPQINYGSIAEIVGGHGELVTDPGEIRAALNRALQANTDGRVAILDIIIGDEMEYLGPMMKESH